jgi:hypothetical protein
MLAGMKVGRRGNVPENRYTRGSRKLRDLSDVLLRNYDAVRATYAARVFRAVPELRVAKRIRVG